MCGHEFDGAGTPEPITVRRCATYDPVTGTCTHERTFDESQAPRDAQVGVQQLAEPAAPPMGEVRRLGDAPITHSKWWKENVLPSYESAKKEATMALGNTVDIAPVRESEGDGDPYSSIMVHINEQTRITMEPIRGLNAPNLRIGVSRTQLTLLFRGPADVKRLVEVLLGSGS